MVLMLVVLYCVVFTISSSWMYSKRRRRLNVTKGLFAFAICAKPTDPDLHSAWFWCRAALIFWVTIVVSMAALVVISE